MRAGPPARLEDPRTAAAASVTLWATGRGLLGGRGTYSMHIEPDILASQQLEEDLAENPDSDSWSEGAARARAKGRGQELAGGGGKEYDEAAEIGGLDDDEEATTTDGETEERAGVVRTLSPTR